MPGKEKLFPEELIDVLHQVLHLWEKSQREEMLEVLKETGYGQGDVFYKVAQAISETIPNDNKEKKLPDGFLTGKARLMEESQRPVSQRVYSNDLLLYNFPVTA